MTELPEYKLRAVFFDLDDTLLPTTEFAKISREGAIKSLINRMKIYGMPVNKRRIKKLLNQAVKDLGSSSDKHIDTLVERLKVPEEKRSRLISSGISGYRKARAMLEPFPETIATLRALKSNAGAGYRLYGISEGVGKYQWAKLQETDLDWLLDDSFITSDYKFRSKNKEFYQKALEMTGLEGKYCLMVGNRIDSDIIPARACGMHTARLLAGKYKNLRVDGEEDAEYRIKNIEDVLRIIPLIEKAENDRLKSLIADITK